MPSNFNSMLVYLPAMNKWPIRIYPEENTHLGSKWIYFYFHTSISFRQEANFYELLSFLWVQELWWKEEKNKKDLFTSWWYFLRRDGPLYQCIRFLRSEFWFDIDNTKDCKKNLPTPKKEFSWPPLNPFSSNHSPLYSIFFLS